MMGGMFFMMPWMILGGLLFLALLVALVWLLVHWLNTLRTPVGAPPWQEGSTGEWQQGYQAQRSPSPEMPPQEGDRVYQGSSASHEQPQIDYPQMQEPPH